MKKHILMLLALVMAVCLLAMPAAAEGEVVHCFCDATYTNTEVACPTCGEKAVTWEPWTGTVATGKYYYLTEDIDYGAKIEVNFAIDLNGYNWIRTNGRLSELAANLAVTNTGRNADGSVKGGVMSGTYTGSVARGGTMNVTSGSLDLYPGVTARTGTATVSYGGVFDVRGTLNLRGATIDATGVTANICGGAVCAETNGILNVYSGTILGGTSENGSAVAAGQGTKTGTVKIYGGRIESGTVKVIVGSVEVSGNAYVENLDMNGELLTVGTNGLAETARIGVTTTVGAKFLDSTASHGTYAATNFMAAGTGAQVVEKADGLYLEEQQIVHCFCDATYTNTEVACPTCGEKAVIWEKWPGKDNLETAKNYYLTADLALGSELLVSNNMGLDLNGFDWTHTIKIATVNEGATVKICNTGKNNDGSVKGGVLSGGNTTNTGTMIVKGTVTLYKNVTATATNAATYAGVFRVQGGSLYIKGATVNGTDVSASTNDNGGGAIAVTNGGHLYLVSGTINGGKAINGGAVSVVDGSFEMSGGTINGGEATEYGGTVYVAADASFDLIDGTITGGSAKRGGAVYNGGTVTMSNGSINSGNASGFGGAVFNNADFTMTGGAVTGGRVTGADGVKAGYDVYLGGSSSFKLDGEVSVGNLAMGGTAYVQVTANFTTKDAAQIRIYDRTDPYVIAVGATKAQMNFLTPENTVYDSQAFAYYDTYNEMNGVVLMQKALVRIGEQKFAKVEDAVAAAGNNMVILMADVTDIDASGKTLYLDLDGHNVTGTVTADTLCAIDTATRLYGEPVGDNAANTYGTIANVAGNVEPFHMAGGRRYLTITDDEGTHFHRYYIAVTAVSIAPGSSAFTYKAAFLGDAKVAEVANDPTKNVDFGMKFQIAGYEEVDSASNKTFVGGPYTDEHHLEHNYVTYKVQNVLGTDAAANTANVTKAVTAKAYIKVGETYDYSVNIVRSFNDVLQKADTAYATMADGTLKTALFNMFMTYYTGVESWTEEKFPNLHAAVTA